MGESTQKYLEGIKIKKNIPSEIYEALNNKFDEYCIVNTWELDNVYYICVYSDECFYFCRFRLGHGYPYKSIYIDLDNKVTLADIKNEMKKRNKNR